MWGGWEDGSRFDVCCVGRRRRSDKLVFARTEQVTRCEEGPKKKEKETWITYGHELLC